MYGKRPKARLKNNPFVKIMQDSLEVENVITSMLKTLYSERASFSIDKIDISIIDEESPVITVHGVYSEQVWDVEKQCLLDNYNTTEINVGFEYDYFNFEDLALIIYGKLLNVLEA